MPFEFDERRVSRAIRRAEVVSVFFPWFDKALILDTRFDHETPPAVFVDSMAGSADERLLWLTRQRPRLGRPTRLVGAPWPAGVRSFIDSGHLDQMVARVRRLGFPELEVDCTRAVRRLHTAEQAVKRAYVRGERCRTVYSR
ncbi:MAG: hypothetical protein IT340_21400 [Chloroflexi bacterium]|nr:hypothetical protein [Chloroflexota bacterium]